MKRAEAEKLLGGYATGTLTTGERRTLFEAALAHQDLFDALADEEALRELLADPAARAQVLATLAAPAPNPTPNPTSAKVVPLWRRPGILGAAAGVLMASLAGLAWLRNPQAPPPAQQEAPALKPLALPETAGNPASAAEPGAEKRRAAPRPVPESPAPTAPMPAPPPSAPRGVPGGVPGGVVGGLVGGVVGGVVGRPQAQAPVQARDQLGNRTPAPAAGAPEPVPAPSSQPLPAIRDRALEAAGVAPSRPASQAVVEVLPSAPPDSSLARAKAVGGLAGPQAPVPPTWTLTSQPDGTTLVTVAAPPGAHVWLLRRGAGGVEVLQDRAVALEEVREAQRRYLVRLKAGDVLDLYASAHPVADPSKLPETGPMAGFRARIFPAEEKEPVP